MAARFDVPEIDAFTRPYWDAAAGGRLLLRRCGACGRAHHYPREFCPHCWSEAVTWERASGRATLYTWSVVHRNDLPPFGTRTPYVAAVVDLEEGPRMMTEVVDRGEEELRAGMALEVAFRAQGAEDAENAENAKDAKDAKDVEDAEGAAGGVVVPVFRPASRGPASP
ncbi:putative OB-fold protein [Streptomyces sp. V3I8]|uniref:Zn-ribbon domain-containing OB-fold protein n=1 Tax=Streptomyces sp. V3I8 TaxID=3042279 RepID=UPI00278A456A|nr:Zn-ribbon domain-containing OB-fold protein [Streptomyces sp. V3I8]MDQ1036950.1 putative OB-fold protein [Streptomyces sp. V3I8]